ncbi:MAG: hypothetical protein J7496_16150 [Novosphingobium sp.]|nr:hypothetical protein [Novosphingobium sp.]
MSQVDPRNGSDRNLVRYLGSGHSTAGLVLFFLGIGICLATTFYLAMGDYSRSDWPLAAYPLWGVVAVPLGLSMRRKAPTRWQFFLACVWLGIAIASCMFMKFNGK